LSHKGHHVYLVAPSMTVKVLLDQVSSELSRDAETPGSHSPGDGCIPGDLSDCGVHGCHGWSFDQNLSHGLCLSVLVDDEAA
jgi:hypothetical protein